LVHEIHEKHETSFLGSGLFDSRITMEKTSEFKTLKSICQRRKSIRSFDEQPLSDAQIASIRDIASTAPYASGKKNWELLVVTGRGLIRELAGIVQARSNRLSEQVREDFRGMFLEYAEHFTAFESAPALFIPVYKVQSSLSLMLEGADDEVVRWERDNYVKSISGVTMLVLLAAESLGLGACCMTGPLLAEKEIARRIGVKRGFEVGAVIPVGYPKGEI
jgi:nitroreductase